MPIQSSDTTTTIAVANPFDAWVIEEGVSVAPFNDDDAFYSQQYGTVLVNYGRLVSGHAGVDLAGAANAQVENELSGLIMGRSFGIEHTSGNFSLNNAGNIVGEIGVLTDGDNIDLRNEGEIRGSAAGINVADSLSCDVQNSGVISGGAFALIFNPSPTVPTTIENSGLITGPQAIYLNPNATGALSLDNSGTIRGDINLSPSTSANVLLNTGTIRGAILLGGGADQFLGAGGMVVGTISGGGGNDLLVGGSGDDVIVGGLGRDRMDGGKGSGEDVFVFTDIKHSRLAAPDLITRHFGPEDTFDLSLIDARTDQGGVQHLSFGGLVSEGAALAAGVVRYYAKGGDTFVVIDTSGDGAADFKLQIHGAFTLNAGEFQL